MKSARIQLVLIGVVVWITMLFMISTASSAGIIIGGNSTKLGTIIIVSPNPGDVPQANGAALLNALAGISADLNNRYVIKLGPGVYDIGTSSLQMKHYVDLEGSGEDMTVITGNIDNFSSGVVLGANNAEIRFLKVQNTGGGSDAMAICNNDLDYYFHGVFIGPSTFKMTNITVSASGGSSYNFGISNSSSSTTMTNVTVYASGGQYGGPCGIYSNNSPSPKMTNVTASISGGMDAVGISNNSSSPTMTNISVTVSGGTMGNIGVRNDSASPTMTNVNISASGAYNEGVDSTTSGTVRINHSVIKASGGKSIVNYVTTYVGNTQLDGPTLNYSGNLTCAGVYDGGYTFHASICP